MRLAPEVVPRLLGFDLDDRPIRFADTDVRSAEYRADQVLLIGEDGGRDAFGWHLEFQSSSGKRELLRWSLKNAALNEQLGRPIVLIVIYLGRSRSAEADYVLAEADGPIPTNSLPSASANMPTASAAGNCGNLPRS